jgi:hypothetical protein
VVLLSEYEVGPPRTPAAQPDKNNVTDRINDIKR